MCLKGVTMVLVVNLVLINLISYGVEGVRSIISKNEEDIELDRQLSILNKPPIKTFHTEWGDVVDCIDMYKQPAFDHPLLKDHKIQMSPSFSEELKTTETESSNIMSEGIECPDGTVPIRRTRKEDLIGAKSVSFNRNDFDNQYGAVLNLRHPGENYFGANARINVYNPDAHGDQFSAAQIWVMRGKVQTTEHNAMQSGWIVAPFLNGDNRTRVFGYWTGDGYQKTGCWNTLCPGFIQVDKTLYLGIPLRQISTFGGDQYIIDVLIIQDRLTHNWWLKLGGKRVGYWPKSLFTNMDDGAEYLSWGGHVRAGTDGISPPMGSGHIPDTCFFEKLMYVDGFSELVNLNGDMPVGSQVSCSLYSFTSYGYKNPESGFSFAYGGPGGKCS